jgi:hypothetical protein
MSPKDVFSEGKSSTTGPKPTATSSNDGAICIWENVWPMAYFSTRFRCAHLGEVMRTCEVAVQTTFPEHCKCTCLFWTMGVSGEAAAIVAESGGRDKGTAGKLEETWR